MATKKKTAGQKRLGAHWTSRIIGMTKVNPASLKVNPMNWRVHPETQSAAARDAIERLGVIQGIIVNKRTGHIVDGHMRHELAVENGEPLIDVVYVDLSLAEEKLALSIVNPLSELGAMDPEKMAALLGGIDREGGPLDELLAQLAEQASGAIMKFTGDPPAKRDFSASSNPSTTRVLLEAPDVAKIERAIAMTGEANRGRALLIIAAHYIGSREDAAGQHGTESQDSLEDQLTKAFATDPGDSGDARGPRGSLEASLLGA
jgi:ParB-like chromosome segregation protein Spo0J